MSAETILAASPERLRSAAGRLGSAASAVAARSSALHSAGAAVAPSWSGVAADMFRAHCERLSADARTGWTALGRAADALTALAGRLEHAQQLAHESQSLAASAASMRAQIAAMEPSPMIRQYNEEAYAVSGRSAALAAEADRVARDAAAHAASVLREVASSAPSRRDRAWGAVLNLGAADLGAYLRVHLSALPDGAQELAGRELAEMLAAATGDAWSEADVAALFAVLEVNAHNGDFAAGFFNEFGGRETVTLMIDLQQRYGVFATESERFTGPLGIALGAASRNGNLESGVVDAILTTENYGSHPVMLALSQLVEHGTFETGVAVRFGDFVVKRIALVRQSFAYHTAEGGPDGFTIDTRSVVFNTIARTPDAARELLLMRLDEPVLPGGYVEYIDILMHGQYMGPDSGVGALIRAATIDVGESDRQAAAHVVAAFVTSVAEVDNRYGLAADIVDTVGEVAREWWDDLANSSYHAYLGTEWAVNGDSPGIVTHDGRVRVSMPDVVAFVQVGVGDPEARADITAAMDGYTTRLVAEALEMPPGDKRDHLLQRVGAQIEAFSIADSRYRELSGKEADDLKRMERKIVGLVLGEALGKIPVGKPFSFALKLLTNEALDRAFHSQEQMEGLKEGSLQDLKLRLRYKLEVIEQADEAGRIPPHELRSLVEFLAMEGPSRFDGIRDVTDVMNSDGMADVMDGLRRVYLYGDDREV